MREVENGWTERRRVPNARGASLVIVAVALLVVAVELCGACGLW